MAFFVIDFLSLRLVRLVGAIILRLVRLVGAMSEAC